MPFLTATTINKSYHVGTQQLHVLRDLDLTVERGEMVAVVGASGVGKSTLLHLLGALDTPSSGQILIAGQRYDGLGDGELTRLRREKIGFVFQFFNLLPSLTAEENVLLPALIAARRGEVMRRRTAELLARVGLAGRADHLPAELSGGEQQRVSIARALLTEPEIVLADEPTGNLDTRSSGEVLRLLREVNESEGQTLVVVSHDPVVAATATRVVFLRDGRLAGEVAGGSTERVATALTELDPRAP